MNDATKPRGRWFRFSMRTVFVLLTVLGIFFSWLAIQIQWMRDRHEAIEWLRGHSAQTVNLAGPSCPAPWSLRILGERGVSWIVIEGLNFPSDRERERRGHELQRLFPEAEVHYDLNDIRL